MSEMCEICGDSEEVELGLCSKCFEAAPMGVWFSSVGALVPCPIGDLVGEPHEFAAGSGRLAFLDIMGLAGHVHEVCLDCAHPSSEAVVNGGLELTANGGERRREYARDILDITDPNLAFEFRYVLGIDAEGDE